MKRVCVILQARLNSERCPQKMIRPFAGTTLFDIACSKLSKLNTHSIFGNIVSIHEPELFQIANKYPNISFFYRSYESANCDNGLTNIYEWWDQLPFTHAIMFNPCLPFLSLDTIQKFIDDFIESDTDGCFGVISKKDYFWNTKGDMLNEWPTGQDLLNTKAVDTTYQAAHALYAGKLEDIGRGIWMGDWRENPPVLYSLNEEECLDIDYEWQFKMLEQLYANEEFRSRYV